MPKLRLFGSALVLVLIAGSSPCFAQTIQPDSSQTKAEQAPEAHGSNSPETPTLQERNPRYQVSPSDILSISFPLIPEITAAPVTVQPNSFITLPNGAAGCIRQRRYDSSNQSISDPRRIRRQCRDPIVSVDITNFQPPDSR